MTPFALLLVLALPAQAIRGGHGAGVSLGVRGAGRVTAQSSPMTFSWKPDCASGGDWVLCCQTVVDGTCGSGYGFACNQGDGTSITLTNKCGDGSEDAPSIDSSGNREKIIDTESGSNEIFIPGATGDSLDIDDIWISDHTVVMSVHNADEGGGQQTAFAHAFSSVNGVQMGNKVNRTRCDWYASGTNIAVLITDILEGAHGLITCRKDGTSYTVRNTGNDGSTTDSNTVTAPTSENVRFGFGANSAAGVQWLIVYDSALTDADIDSIEGRAMGIASTPDTLVWTRDSRAYLETPGPVYFGLTFDGTYAQADGVDIWGEATNNWTNSLDASASTPVGTSPVSATDSDSGPFSLFNRGAEADTLNDDDGAAFEGIESPSDTSLTDGDYTCQVFLASGTETGYTIDLFKDGVSMGSCSANDLTSTFTQKVCTQNTGGAPTTDTYCQVLVGDSAADTGTIKVSGMQFGQTSREDRVCLAGGSSTTCNKDVVSMSTDGWPVSAGIVELEFTPYLAPFDFQRLYFFRDPEGQAMYLDDTNILYAESKGPGGSTTTQSSALTWNVGTTYRIKFEWNAAGEVYIYRDDVLVGSGTGRQVPTSLPSTAYIGSNGSVQQINGRIRNFMIRK